ncbi:PTS sugar transporter subunit IIA [Bacillus sp. N9]
MNEMIGIVLTGHGAFPTGMLESVQLIAGEIRQIKIVPFEEDVEKLEREIEHAINSVDTGAGVVCFTDLAGGTPFNICSKLALKNESVRVIGGTNSPMLLSGLFQREFKLDEFVAKVLQDGKENIKEFETRQKQSVVDGSAGI